MSEKSSAGGGARKSLCWTYFWWLFGGEFGAHHVYLGRDEQAIVWLFTGGGFALGWFRDCIKIPKYVAEVNDQHEYQEEWFKQQRQQNKKPPYNWLRCTLACVLAYWFGQLVLLAIPKDEVNGMNLKPLMVLVPLAVSLGIWLVGNIGRERGSLWQCTFAAYIFYPFLDYIGNEDYWLGLMIVSSTLVFNFFAKDWRTTKKPKRSLARSVMIFVAIAIVYALLLGSIAYFNGSFVDAEGEEIKLSEAIEHFWTSPIWVDLQVLGLSLTASQSQITSTWRKLSRENHPDKCKGTPEECQLTQERFLDIQQAYEIISSAKNRRERKNKKSTDEL
ncbi:unnamed protein product [Trichogramma brassicae]|uniref:DnaJ homolog subfamily C member 22 n=1 Tax=Trichogramma brassicae TaxID=86971 RepID=A0A6H5IZM7_9HYME|nr:unnamed protein product [Trichogramma brassicae]